jgi:demethylmenaquinone methyltransferase/2-methoxy-6-polyprenyl-1,4-benzoquinol methylase
MPIIDHFGLIAPFYDHAIPLRQLEKYLELAELPIVGDLLDVGGGTGRVAEALKAQVSQVVVVDASMEMLVQAQKKNGLSLTRSYSESLPFRAETFERVIMVDALHHVIDQQNSASEIWRVVKPGGLVVILEPDIRKIAVKGVAIIEKVLLMRSHFLSPERIAKIFSFPDAELRVVEDGFNSWVCARKIGY